MVQETKVEETVDLRYVINQAIDAAEREGSMVLGTMVYQLNDAGLTQQANLLQQVLNQRIPVSTVPLVLSQWITEDDLAAVQ